MGRDTFYQTMLPKAPSNQALSLPPPHLELPLFLLLLAILIFNMFEKTQMNTNTSHIFSSSLNSADINILQLCKHLTTIKHSAVRLSEYLLLPCGPRALQLLYSVPCITCSVQEEECFFLQAPHRPHVTTDSLDNVVFYNSQTTRHKGEF